MSADNEPFARLSVFPISCAIFRNHTQRGEVFYGCRFEKRYRDEQGNWKSSNSFTSNDLLPLSHAAQKAFDEVQRLRSADKDAQDEDQAA